MKKTLHIVLVTTILLSLFALVSCGEMNDLSKQTMEYLENKYEKDTFEIAEVPKNKSVTGRYELTAQSKDDGVDFDVYVYTFFITDSYSVTRANISAGEKIRGLIDSDTLSAVKDIIVYPIYDDGGTDYRFTSLPIDNHDILTEIDNIVLNEINNTDAVSESVWNIIKQLNDGGITLNKVRFTFELGGYTVCIETNSEYVLSLNEEQLNMLVGGKVDSAVLKAKESGNIFAEKTVTIGLDKDSETETEATETPETSANLR